MFNYLECVVYLRHHYSACICKWVIALDSLTHVLDHKRRRSRRGIYLYARPALLEADTCNSGNVSPRRLDGRSVRSTYPVISTAA